MTTINQVLTPTASPLGHWYMWANDVVGQLGALTITPKRKIAVTYEPSLHTSTDGFTWDCQHAHTSLDVVEYWDVYRESVSGERQPVTYKTMIVCEDCNAWQIPGGEIWYE